jgi:hypothetical protein
MTTTDRLERAIEQTRQALAELEQLQVEMGTLREQAPDLIGAREAAELMQIERHEFSRRRRQGRIPPPIAELAAGPVWLRAQFTWPNTLKESA